MQLDEKKKYFKELSKKIEHDYFDFLTLIHRKYSLYEAQMILKAYRFAEERHHNQKRKCGSPYITHPLSVSYILAEVGFDYKTICAGLLHDVVEDTPCTLEELKEEFDDDIATLVDGVTKMKGSDFNSKEESVVATHKKILNSITKDARIIAIKLSDRLHNMFTLEYLSERKQKEIANETKDFYINLARIIGSYQVKDELQDLCLYTLNKEKFLEIYELRQDLKRKYAEEFHYIGRRTKEKLSSINVLMDYNIKIKNSGAIYDESLRGNKTSEIDDLLALRMLVENVHDCYKTLGVVHETCKPVKCGFCDYIASPKYNGYMSLNTNVLYNDSNFQVRIRTNDMQKSNELGIISNWSKETQQVLSEKCDEMFEANKKELKRKGF